MRKCILFAAALVFASLAGTASAQDDQLSGDAVAPLRVRCTDGPAGTSAETLLNAVVFMLPWHEVEGDFQGTFTPVDRRPWRADAPHSRYSAMWRKGGELARADLDITVQDRAVTIVRRQREGTCSYTGRILDDWRVEGSYSCLWHAGQLPWKAVIGPGRQSIDCPASGMADPRLNQVWHEQEDGWSGQWTPRGGYGLFEATWRKGRDAPPYAGLAITLEGRQVSILRTGPEGTCRYGGHLAGNGWTASGFYTCDWHRLRIPWSATIGDGHP